MRANAVLPALVLAMVAMSGCLADDEAPFEPQLGPGDDDFNPFDDEVESSEDPAEEPVADDEPEAEPSGSEAVLISNQTDGQAPISIRFDFSVAEPTNGTDEPAGGNETTGNSTAGNSTAGNSTAGNQTSAALPDPEGQWAWRLDIGEASVVGDGSALPANHTFEFTMAGTYAVVFTATDGDETLTAQLEIVVSEAETPAEPPTNGDGPEFPDDPNCKTDPGAILVPGVELYVTDFPGVAYIYGESNGVAGLQRNDAAWDNNCVNPDTLIF